MKINGIEFLVGADPELFLRSRSNMAYIPAGKFVKGTKRNPFPVYKGSIQKDGLAAEFNIDPAKDADTFVYNIQCVMDELRKSIGQDDVDLMIKPSVRFTKKVLDEVPEEDKRLGCMPDYNAYTRTVNPIPVKKYSNMAVAGGHIHIGWTKDQNPEDEDHLAACIELTKQLDTTLGLRSLLYDKDTQRRTLYGKLGAFRPKPYGVEYRVLSNYWLSNPRYMRSVFDGVVRSIELLFRNEGKTMEFTFNDKTTLELFNGGNFEEVKQAVARLNYLGA